MQKNFWGMNQAPNLSHFNMNLQLNKLINLKTINASSLMVALMVSYFLNFLFNAYLGRILSFEEFGLVATINTFWYMALVPINALYGTVNHKTAYLQAKNNQDAEMNFFHMTSKRAVPIGIGISLLWLIATPVISNFFVISNMLVSMLFTPVILTGVLVAVHKGFLHGKFRFTAVAIIIVSEALSKLLFAWLFASFHLLPWVYVSIPLSVIVSFITSYLFIRTYETKKEILGQYSFPRHFFIASIIASLSSMAFLTFDLLLAKHFLSPVAAGQYALLSLVGKIVFFLGVLPNTYMFTFVSNEQGRGMNPNKVFYKLFAGTIALSGTAFIALGPLGQFIVPTLFGEKTRVILPYLVIYTAGIMLYSVASSIVSFHLAKKQYFFPAVSVLVALGMSYAIYHLHKDVSQITYVIFWMSILSVVVLGALHYIAEHTHFALSERWVTKQYE